MDSGGGAVPGRLAESVRSGRGRPFGSAITGGAGRRGSSPCENYSHGGRFLRTGGLMARRFRPCPRYRGARHRYRAHMAGRPGGWCSCFTVAPVAAVSAAVSAGKHCRLYGERIPFKLGLNRFCRRLNRFNIKRNIQKEEKIQ